MQMLSCMDMYPAPIPLLPIVNMDDKTTYTEWVAYLQRVYPGRTGYVDLNTFTFFYWDAPLVTNGFHFSTYGDGLPHIKDGTPWVGGGPYAWTWGPEHMIRRVGFFVARKVNKIQTRADFEAGALEVLRYGPNAFVDMMEGNGQDSWFFHTIGSGIYITPNDQIYWNFNMYKTGMSAPREEIVIGHNDSHNDNAFWPSALTFHMYNMSRCSFAPTYDDVLHCEEQRTAVFLDTITEPSPSVCDNSCYSAIRYLQDELSDLHKEVKSKYSLGSMLLALFSGTQIPLLFLFLRWICRWICRSKFCAKRESHLLYEHELSTRVSEKKI